MKKNAFTLAEVLITLVIIGVIAAMTIPTLMGSTNNQELKSKQKKAISAVNQAIKLDQILYGNQPIDFIGNDLGVLLRFKQTLMNHMSVVETEVSGCQGESERCFKTSDGFIYSLFPNNTNPPSISVMLKVTGQWGDGFYEGKGFSMRYDSWGGSKAFVDECTAIRLETGMPSIEEEMGNVDCIHESMGI